MKKNPLKIKKRQDYSISLTLKKPTRRSFGLVHKGFSLSLPKIDENCLTNYTTFPNLQREIESTQPQRLPRENFQDK